MPSGLRRFSAFDKMRRLKGKCLFMRGEIIWPSLFIINVFYNFMYIKDSGDNFIQTFHLRRNIRRYTSRNVNFEYCYPHSNAFLQFRFKLERYKPHKTAQRRTSSNEMCRNKRTSNYFRQYIAGYTVIIFGRYPIRIRVTKASALEYCSDNFV